MFTRTVQHKIENFSKYIYLQLSRPQTCPNHQALNLNPSPQSTIIVLNNKKINKKGICPLAS